MNQITRYGLVCLSFCSVAAVAFTAMMPVKNDNVLQLRGGGTCVTSLTSQNCGPLGNGITCSTSVSICVSHHPNSHKCVDIDPQLCIISTTCDHLLHNKQLGAACSDAGEEGGEPTLDLPPEIDP